MPATKPTFAQLATGAHRNHPRYRGCIGHWLMVDGAGLRCTDVSGYDQHGTLTNSPAWRGGRTGPCLDFDGTGGDQVACGSAAIADDLVTMSISAWIYIRTFGQSISANFCGGILAKNRATLAWNFCLANSVGIQLVFVKSHTTTSLVRRSSNNTFTTNLWYHVGMSFTRLASDTPATNARLYINGTETGYASSIAGVSTTGSDAAGVLCIGNNNNSSDQTFDGRIDDVRLYNRILARAEFQSLYMDPHLEFTQPVRRFRGQAPQVVSPRLFPLLGVGR